MRVLLLSPAMFDREGGIERLMRLSLKALCELCDSDASGRESPQVYSLAFNDTPGGTSAEQLAPYSTRELIKHEGLGRRKLHFAWRVCQLARRNDLIFCGHINQLVVARLAQLINPRLRYCVDAHGIEVWRPYTRIERWALRGAARIFCGSDFTRKQVLRFADGALSPSRLKTVYNVLDPQLMRDATDGVTTAVGAADSDEAGAQNGTHPARHEFADTADNPSATQAPVILSVGRLSQSDAYKGFDTLIEAMPAVLREYPAARLRIVGTGDDLARLHALAQTCGVSVAVDFVGRISDPALAREYAQCTLFAMPSRGEGFGLVYLEAMVRGKPCLAAQAGGAPEVIGSDAGLCVRYGNVPEIAAAICELVRCPPAAEAVRRRAEAFSFERFREKLATVLPPPLGESL